MRLLPAQPTFDGDRRQLVARCARRGIPAAVLDHQGYLTLVRNLDDLDALNQETR